jgi:hypothetical protein
MLKNLLYLKEESRGFLQKLIAIYQTMRRHIPEDSNLCYLVVNHSFSQYYIIATH